MSALFRLTSSERGKIRRRRLWLLALVAGIVAVILAILLLLRFLMPSAEDRARSHGYIAVGSQADDMLWAKVAGAAQISVLSTGKDGALCNSSGPDEKGFILCSDGVAGQGSMIVMVAPTGAAQVRLETSEGSLTLKTVNRVPGMRNVLAFGVLRNGGTAPVIVSKTYLDAQGNEVAR